MAEVHVAEREGISVERSQGIDWRSVKRRLGLAAAYGALLLMVALICAPLLWMLLASVKTRGEIYTLPISWIPEKVHLDNFSKAWTSVPFGHYFVNSLVVTFTGSGLKVINGVMTAYALAFLSFPRKNLVFLFVLAALMVPEEVAVIPNYVFISDRGWVNTYQGIVIPGAGVAFGTFLMRQHFLTLPREVIEAARIDGAGHLRML